MVKYLVIAAALVGMLFVEAESADAGFFSGRNQIRINVNNNGRRNNGRQQIRINVNNRGRNRNRNNNNINIQVRGARFGSMGNSRVNGHTLGQYDFNGRFNSFGTRTFADNNGNIFEEDAFGNVRFVGNAFNRGFQGTAFGGFHSAGFSAEAY